jgi:hypothetical protein
MNIIPTVYVSRTIYTCIDGVPLAKLLEQGVYDDMLNVFWWWKEVHTDTSIPYVVFEPATE